MATRSSHTATRARWPSVDYGTALGVIRRAHEQGKRIKVFADETRPRLQGARLTAWELMRWGIDVTLIATMRRGITCARARSTSASSDRIAPRANGDVANKIGTYKLAVLAKENGIPFYPVLPTSTIDLSLPNGDLIPIEERDEREVTEIDGVRIAPIGVKVGNPAFDVTPRKYVTGIVTENGIAYPPFEMSLRKVVSTAVVSRQSSSCQPSVVSIAQCLCAVRRVRRTAQAICRTFAVLLVVQAP